MKRHETYGYEHEYFSLFNTVQDMMKKFGKRYNVEEPMRVLMVYTLDLMATLLEQERKLGFNAGAAYADMLNLMKEGTEDEAKENEEDYDEDN